MKPDTAWKGRYARVITTGEVVEVISYNALCLQVKTAHGFGASLSREEVIAVHGPEQEAESLRKKP